MNFIKKYWFVILLVVIGAAVFFGWRSRPQAAGAANYETVPAVRGNLTATLGETGVVRAGQTAQLAWQTSGEVETVNVKIGDTVKDDAVLASLAQTSMPQGIILAEAELINARKALDEILSSKTALAAAQQKLAQAKRAIEDAQDKVDGLNYPRATDNLIQQTAANLVLAQKELQNAEDNYKNFKKRPDGDADKAAALLRVTNARQRITDLTANYNWYTGKADSIDAEEYRANLALLQAQMADAQREIDRLKDGPNADDVAAAKARLAAAQSTLKLAQVTAPFDGVITQAFAQPGDLVSPNTLAFRLDNLSHLKIDLEISEVDINSIHVQQSVTVVLDAVKGKTYAGQVEQISQAGDKKSGAVNFTVTIALTDADNLVRPGMTASVTIAVKELKDVLLVPTGAVQVVDNKRVVYVLKGNQPVAVEVRLGAASDTHSEVVGGDLQEDDLIILNPPRAGASGLGLPVP